MIPPTARGPLWLLNQTVGMEESEEVKVLIYGLLGPARIVHKRPAWAISNGERRHTRGADLR